MRDVTGVMLARAFIAAAALTCAGWSAADAQQRQNVTLTARASRPTGGEEPADPHRLRALEVVRGEIERSKKYSSTADRVVVVTAAADVLWDFDHDAAKAALREAFGEVRQASPAQRPGESDYSLGLRRASLRERLRLDILKVVQRREPKSLEEFTAVPEEKRAQLNSIRTRPQFFGSSSSEKRSLARLAASVAKSDPDLAVRLSVESLGYGVPEETQEVFRQLLAYSPERAHTLFARLTDAYAADDSQNLYDSVIISYYLKQLPGPTADAATARRFLGAAYERISRVRELTLADGDKGVQSAVLLALTYHLPLARVYWPELADKMWTLARQVSPDAKPGDERAYQNTFAPEDDVDSILSRAESEKGAEAKDSLYFQAALLLVKKGEFSRALDVASKAGEGPKRDKFTAYVLRSQAEALIEAGEFNDARKVLGKLDDPEERADAAVRFVSAARKKDPYLARVVLDDVRKSIEGNVGSAGHARAYLWLASSYSGIDPADGAELMSAAVKFANRAGGLEGLSPEPKLLDFGGVVRQSVTVGETKADFLPGFRALARYDFTRTLQLAEGFDNELLRGMSLVAASGSVLKGAAPRPKVATGLSVK